MVFIIQADFFFSVHLFPTSITSLHLVWPYIFFYFLFAVTVVSWKVLQVNVHRKWVLDPRQSETIHSDCKTKKIVFQSITFSFELYDFFSIKKTESIHFAFHRQTRFASLRWRWNLNLFWQSVSVKADPILLLFTWQ